MTVLTGAQIAEKLAERAQCDLETAQQGMAAILGLMGQKLGSGTGVRLRAFAEITPADERGEPSSNQILEIPSEEAESVVEGTVDVKGARLGEFLESFIQVVRQALLSGETVELEGLFTLNVTEDAANQRRVISFTASEAMKASQGALKFNPDPALRAQVKTLRNLAILLLVPERDIFVRTMEYHFQRAGWSVQTEVSGQEALARIEDGAFLNIVDANVADHQTFLEKVKCTMGTSLIPIITVHPAETDPKKAKSFRICADQMVIEPFEVKSLLDKADNELARVAEEEAIFRQEVRFQFPTTEDDVNNANKLAARLFEQSGLSDEGQVAMSAAFREAVGNAAQHGNRYRRDKTIEVLYLLDDKKITANVTDMGKGFDHRFYTHRGEGGDALGAARERHRQGKLGGLGIMLMLKCTDKLEYNDMGNSVTLTKLLTSGS